MSFIFDPQSVDQSVSSQITGLCPPSGGWCSCGCKAQPLSHMEVASRYRLEIRCYKQVFSMALKALRSSRGALCQSVCCLTRSRLCFFHCVLKNRQFPLNGSSFLSLATGLLFQRKSPRGCSNSSFIWVRSDCPCVAAQVSILAVFIFEATF